MDNATAQHLLAEAKYYKAAPDGIIGPATRKAISIVEKNAGLVGFDDGGGWPQDTPDWPWDRRLVAAAQRVLVAQGFDAGPVDGWVGPQTREAVTQWRAARLALSATVGRVPLPLPAAQRDLPRQIEVTAFYGTPGPGGTVEQRLTYAAAPYDLRIDWNLGQTTRRIRVHQKCAPALEAALAAVLAEYGAARIRDLGIDRYAGAYNPRRMRGGKSWSMHAYGCAIDFYAQPNGLRTRCPDALFCGREYTPFLDIMESHGWLPAIRLWGADAMHFQMARL